MECPYCGSENRTVLETRFAHSSKRRRNHCGDCEKRFTTYEFASEKLDKVFDLLALVEQIDIDPLVGLLSELQKLKAQPVDLRHPRSEGQRKRREREESEILIG